MPGSASWQTGLLPRVFRDNGNRLRFPFTSVMLCEENGDFAMFLGSSVCLVCVVYAACHKPDEE